MSFPILRVMSMVQYRVRVAALKNDGRFVLSRLSEVVATDKLGLLSLVDYSGADFVDCFKKTRPNDPDRVKDHRKSICALNRDPECNAFAHSFFIKRCETSGQRNYTLFESLDFLRLFTSTFLDKE